MTLGRFAFVSLARMEIHGLKYPRRTAGFVVALARAVTPYYGVGQHVV